MKSNLNRPIWPYMVILSILFTASMRAPRAWQRVASDESLAPKSATPRRDAAVRLASTALQPSIDARIPTISATTVVPAVAVQENPVATGDDELEEILASVADPADAQAADRAADHETQPELAADEPLPALTFPSEQTERPVHKPMPGGMIFVLTEPEGEAEPTGPQLTATATQPPLTAAPDNSSASDASIAEQWPAPENLLQSLERLANDAQTEAWASKTTDLIHRLIATAHLPAEHQANGDRLIDLRRLADQSKSLAQESHDATLRTALLRARFALRRRLPFWEAALGNDAVTNDASEVTDAELLQHVRVVDESLGDSKADDAWRGFLLLAKLRDALQNDSAISGDERRELREQILERLGQARAKQESRDFAQQDFFMAFDTALRRWSFESVSKPSVLRAVEAYEQDQTQRHVQEVFRLHRTLALSSDRQEQRLAEAIGKTYRNANFRLAVTDDLLNRWLPRDATVAEPVRDRLLGARVVGRSQTTTDVHLRLLPSNDSLRMVLEARGRVYSKTSAESGPAIFYNAGRATFMAEKELIVDASGIRALPSESSAQSRSNLLSVDTSFDSIPLLGSFARGVARSQHDDSQSDANAITQRKIAARARAELDEQVDDKVQQLAEEVRQRFWSPLVNLDLAPTPVELRTTDDRAVMRLRLADGYQLAAHTPRPQAPADSLASIQLHESALNNLLQRFELEGRTFELSELYAYLAKKLGRPPELPEDLPNHVHLTFADHEAMRVRCEGGRLKMTLQLARLETPRDTFQELEVVAYYQPQVRGMHTELARKDSIRLQGEHLNMRDQIVLRGVFSKVFSRNRPWQVIDAAKARDPRLSQMQVTELVLEDGWLGLSIGPLERASSNIARQPLPMRMSN
ncbi:MAG: hypothetical protein KDA42_04350 [Planctomycetales bacterium]|nr:hypothetical protein [Planctomycetales bacterium]